ncbi:MAG: hypothetical protein ACPGXK_03305 [Phycisphaerae bacterium]
MDITVVNSRTSRSSVPARAEQAAAARAVPVDRRRGIFVVVISVAAVLLIILPLGLWMAFQRKPHWYSPVSPEPAVVKHTSNEFLKWADRISDEMVRRRPFEIEISASEVTHFASAAPAMFPEEFSSWPPEITDPAVTFEGGLIKVGFHCDYEGWRVIAVFHIEMTLLDADTLHVRLDGIRGGALPVPQGWVRDVADPLLKRWQQKVDDLPTWLADLQSVDQLYEGMSIPNRFVWPNGKRRFRIDGISPQHGTLGVKIEPY